MSSRDRFHAARAGGMRPPSAPPTGMKRKEREFDESTSDETNINVVVRCRGRNDREVRENSGVVVSTTGGKGKSVRLCMGPNAIVDKVYNFDKVFSPVADQSVVFEDVVLPVLEEMLCGFNCTIFAYGQTGTGKTYTMSGDMTDTLGLLSDNAGIIPRVLYSLFSKLENNGVECSVKCSFIELYNEDLRDLLASDDTAKLKIFDDARKSHIATVVQGMEESYINSAAEGIKKLREGSHRRQVAATKCNDLSSRGHTVFTISTHMKKAGTAGGDDMICSGKLNLVDLAGSENIQRSGAENKRAVEAGLINKSLLTLGRVINALVDKSAHIPYRESKLTRILQDSLGGRTKTCIIATISPARSNLEETISTLDYAFRAKNIRNKPQVNSIISKKTLLREFTTEIEKLKSELIATRQRNGVYLTNEQYEEITVESESRRILSEEQKARIGTMEASLRNKVQELFNVVSNFTDLKKDSEVTRQKLESTSDILEKTKIVLDDTEQLLREETELRKAHQATENKLRKIGTELITTVDGTTRDLDGVHEKLRRRSALHQRNRNAWVSSAVEVTNTSDEVDVRIGQLKDQFADQLGNLSTRLGDFIAVEMGRVIHNRRCLEAMSAGYTSQTLSLQHESAKAKDELDDVLEEIKELREDVKAKVGQGLHGLSDAAARISAEVTTELQQFHTRLHTSYSGLGKDFKIMFEDITEELAAQRATVNALKSELQAANRRHVEATVAASVELKSSLEMEREAASEDKEQLLQQITNLISTSHSKRDERLSNAITRTQASITTATSEFGRANQSFHDGMERWNVSDTALLSKVNASKESLETRMKKDWTAVEAQNITIQSSTEAVHAETMKIVDAQLSAMATQMAALDEFVTRARGHNGTRHQSQMSALTSLTSHVEQNLESLEAQLGIGRVQDTVERARAQIEELVASLTPLDTELRHRLQTLSFHLNNNGLEDYVPTGETPQRRDWSYPTDLPVTVSSTTPPSRPIGKTLPSQTPSRTRSPRKTSPRKAGSPRKIIKEVYMDSPIQLVPAPGINVLHQLERSESAKSVTTLSSNSGQSQTNHAENSLKEVDLNAGNNTISFPIVDEKPGKKARTGPVRSLRAKRSKKDWSASVNGAGEQRAMLIEKENFNPSKSVNAAASALVGLTTATGTGRRLRSSPTGLD